jgi:hypothetical protein
MIDVTAGTLGALCADPQPVLGSNHSPAGVTEIAAADEQATQHTGASAARQKVNLMAVFQH